MRNKILWAVLIVAFFLIVFIGILKSETASYERHNALVFRGEAQYGYVLIAAVDSNDTAETDGTVSWADIYANRRTMAGVTAGTGRWFEIPEQISTAVLSFFAHGRDGNDPNAGSFDISVMVADENGCGKKVFDATLNVGNIQLSHNPDSGAKFRAGGEADPNYKFASEATGFSEQWATAVGTAPEALTSAESDVFEAYFHTLGKRYIKVTITKIDSRLDYVYCIMRGKGG